MEEGSSEVVSLRLTGSGRGLAKLCRTADTLFSDILEPDSLTLSSLGAAHRLLLQILTRYRKTADKDERIALDRCHKNVVHKLLFVCGACSDSQLRSATFKLLMDLLPTRSQTTKHNTLSPTHLSENLKVVVTAEGSIVDFLEILKPYLRYRDVEANLWKALELVMLDPTVIVSERVYLKIIQIIALLEKPKSTDNKGHDEKSIFCGGTVVKKKTVESCVLALWQKLMGLADVINNQSTKQTLLLVVIDQIMPRLNNPQLLTDYFIDCLNQGGAISLLGLQGIFVLVQKHNINYPNIYIKLYSLLDANIFSTPYKARFFYLSDIFLTSSHLAEAVVAGFIKKIARLALTAAPPVDVNLLMAFITNLLVRHPALKYMMDNPTRHDVKSDPYIFEEADPSKSGAIDSSLWEVELLRQHVVPTAASASANLMAGASHQLPTVETDLTDLLEEMETTTTKLFEKEYKKKKMKDSAVCFERPTSLMVPGANSPFLHWNFTG